MLLPYTYPTPKLSPHRRRCISIFPQKNSLCMIYKRFKLWGHWNVLINHLLLVIPMLYPCHYTNLCPHKPHKHAHTHTHAHAHAHAHAHGAVAAVGGSVPYSRAPQSWYWRWRERCTFTPPPPPTIPAGPRFEPATSGYKSDALSIRPRLPRTFVHLFKKHLFDIFTFIHKLSFFLH